MRINQFTPNLLIQLVRDFFTQIGKHLPHVVEPDGSARARAGGVASALAIAFEAHPMLCDLLSAQVGVLEHSVSTEVVARYKCSGYQILIGFTAALRQVLPELSEEDAADATRTVVMLVGALWTHSHPPQAVRDAYAAGPSLVFLPEGFARSLERTIGLIFLGLLAS